RRHPSFPPRRSSDLALSARLAAVGRRLPTVYAAWLAGDALHLQLAWPDGEPPAPWRTGQDQTFWRLDRTTLPADAELGPVAPYRSEEHTSELQSPDH